MLQPGSSLHYRQDNEGLEDSDGVARTQGTSKSKAKAKTKAKAAKASETPGLKWDLESTQYRSANNIPQHYKPWTSQSSTARCLVLREQDILDIAWATLLNDTASTGVSRPKAELCKGVYVNVSLSLGRTKSSGLSRKLYSFNIPTLCRRTSIYSFEGGFLFSGGDHLAALGFLFQYPMGLLCQSQRRRT